MGTINIIVPGDINLRFKVENMDIIKTIIKLVKSAGAAKKKKMKNNDNDIVGIWRDRFDENIPSAVIQKELRKKTWKRFYIFLLVSFFIIAVSSFSGYAQKEYTPSEITKIVFFMVNLLKIIVMMRGIISIRR